MSTEGDRPGSVIQALEIAGVGTWEWDQTADRIVWSSPASARAGRPGGGAVTREELLAAVHPADRQGLRDAIESARAIGTREIDCEFRVVRPDGSHWLRMSGAADARVPALLRGVFTNIDAGKRSERENDIRAAIVESSEDAIIGTTLTAIATSWNKTAERIFGWSAGEIIGRSIAVLAAPDLPDEMPRIFDSVRRGERLDHFETVRRRKDGGIVNVSLTVSPIRDEDGQIVGVSKVARDITQAMQAQAELRRGQAHLQSILDSIPDGMVVIDERGIVRSFSTAAQRMFGYRSDEVCGRNVSMLMPSPYQENHDGYIARYLATNEPRIIGIGRVVAGRRKDGSTFPMELAVGEVLGEPRVFTGFVRDISERQRMRSRMQELQAELSHVSRLSEMGQMASALAHEINQPLAAASNYLQAARRLVERRDEAALDRALAAMESGAAQVARASEIIKRLRSFVKKSEPEQQPENTVTLVEEASALALIGVKESGVRVGIRAAPDIPDVLIDKVQIQQVLVNLMRNAVEAMEGCARRELEVETALADGMVVISVTDTGPGIAPEVRERLFQPFVSTKPQGMGVGLSICRSIVEAHGGRLWAEPNPAGGTIFRFTVPAAP